MYKLLSRVEFFNSIFFIKILLLILCIKKYKSHMNNLLEILEKVKSGELTPEVAKETIETNMMVLLSDYSKRKLQFINGNSISRDFPNVEPNLEWCGAVLDLLDDMKLNQVF